MRDQIRFSKLLRWPQKANDRELPIRQITDRIAVELFFENFKEFKVKLSSVVEVVVPAVRNGKKISRSVGGAKEIDQVVDLLAISNFARLVNSVSK